MLLVLLEIIAECVGLWFWNLLLLYYRLALDLRHRTLEPGLAGTGMGQLVGVQRFSRGLLEDLGDIWVWLFWNIGYNLWKVGNFFLVSIVCDCDCGCACACGSVPSLLRLVYTIDFNELT